MIRDCVGLQMLFSRNYTPTARIHVLDLDKRRQCRDIVRYHITGVVAPFGI